MKNLRNLRMRCIKNKLNDTKKNLQYLDTLKYWILQYFFRFWRVNVNVLERDFVIVSDPSTFLTVSERFMTVWPFLVIKMSQTVGNAHWTLIKRPKTFMELSWNGRKRSWKRLGTVNGYNADRSGMLRTE